MNDKTDTASQNMATLSERTNTAIESGYTENFTVNSKGLVTADGKTIFAPDEIKISNFHRFEGNSNPDDSSILYLIDTNDGRKGTLIDAYGAYADATISSFIREVEDIQKRTKVVF